MDNWNSYNEKIYDNTETIIENQEIIIENQKTQVNNNQTIIIILMAIAILKGADMIHHLIDAGWKKY